MFALAGFELEPLDVVDIGVRRQHAANFSARPAIGVEVDSYPERVALDRGELAFEVDPLSRKRGFEISVIQLVELATFDFDDFAPDHFGLGLAGPLQECPVDESIALERIDVANRQPERVQLALRQREQAIPVYPFALG